MEGNKKTNYLPWIIGGVLLLIGGGFAVWYFFIRKKPETNTTTASTTPGVDPSAAFVPVPPANSAVTVLLTDLERLLISNLPFADNSQILSKLVPLVYDTSFQNIHTNQYIIIANGGVTELPYHPGPSTYPVGSLLWMQHNLQGPYGPNTDLDVNATWSGIKIKDIVWQLTPEGNDTYLKLKAAYYKNPAGKVFPFVDPDGPKFIWVKRQVYTNSGRLKYVSKEMTQNALNAIVS